jgi:hypothetical protein
MQDAAVKMYLPPLHRCTWAGSINIESYASFNLMETFEIAEAQPE